MKYFATKLGLVSVVMLLSGPAMGMALPLNRFPDTKKLELGTPNHQVVRWLSEDPIGEDGGINLYGYVGNSPVMWLDPLGLDAAWWNDFWKGLWRTVTDPKLWAEKLTDAATARPGRCVTVTVPQKARDTLGKVKNAGGKPPAGYVGGKSFQNREGRLPTGGKYREYDIDPKPAKGGTRNRERIVMDENSGRCWYTDDHYGTFTEFK